MKNAAATPCRKRHPELSTSRPPTNEYARAIAKTQQAVKDELLKELREFARKACDKEILSGINNEITRFRQDDSYIPKLPFGVSLLGDPTVTRLTAYSNRCPAPQKSKKQIYDEFLHELLVNPPKWAKMAAGKVDPRYEIALADTVETHIPARMRAGKEVLPSYLMKNIKEHLEIWPEATSRKVPTGKQFTPRALKTR